MRIPKGTGPPLTGPHGLQVRFASLGPLPTSLLFWLQSRSFSSLPPSRVPSSLQAGALIGDRRTRERERGFAGSWGASDEARPAAAVFHTAPRRRCFQLRGRSEFQSCVFTHLKWISEPLALPGSALSSAVKLPGAAGAAPLPHCDVVWGRQRAVS